MSDTERVDLDSATPSQMERANQAVLANLNPDGSPLYHSAQGYACALTAIMDADAMLASLQAENERLRALLGRAEETIDGEFGTTPLVLEIRAFLAKP